MQRYQEVQKEFWTRSQMLSAATYLVTQGKILYVSHPQPPLVQK